MSAGAGARRRPSARAPPQAPTLSRIGKLPRALLHSVMPAPGRAASAMLHLKTLPALLVPRFRQDHGHQTLQRFVGRRLHLQEKKLQQSEAPGHIRYVDPRSPCLLGFRASQGEGDRQSQRHVDEADGPFHSSKTHGREQSCGGDKQSRICLTDCRITFLSRTTPPVLWMPLHRHMH